MPDHACDFIFSLLHCNSIVCMLSHLKKNEKNLSLHILERQYWQRFQCFMLLLFFRWLLLRHVYFAIGKEKWSLGHRNRGPSLAFPQTSSPPWLNVSPVEIRTDNSSGARTSRISPSISFWCGEWELGRGLPFSCYATVLSLHVSGPE